MPRHPAKSPSRSRARGLTLIELMIAMVIGLVVLATAGAMLIGSSASRRQTELSADVIENGRYGLDMLSRELSQAGFYGTLVVPTGSTVAPVSAAMR